MKAISTDSPGNRIRYFASKRYNNNISALAREMGITRQALTDYLTDKTKPGNKLLSKLENSGATPSWILYGRGPMDALGEKPDEADDCGRPISKQEAEIIEENEKLKAEIKAAFGKIDKLKGIIEGLKFALHEVAIEARTGRSGMAFLDD
ncbi:MAG: helix-turn-helix transcriptional regulator [Chlorobi bacterium]|nr:helix-turn-helix transcriptional regulator [Chlorobiota bacterium]